MSEDIGVITKCYTVTFERASKHAASRLWGAITNPDDVEAWMGAPAKVDLRGEYFVDVHGNGENGLDGIIVPVENERKLGYVWGWSYRHASMGGTARLATCLLLPSAAAAHRTSPIPTNSDSQEHSLHSAPPPDIGVLADLP